MNQGTENLDLSNSTEARDEGGSTTSGMEQHRPLLPDQDLVAFQADWQQIQLRFVDEPQVAVEQADGLVAGLMQRLAGTFAEERNRLEQEWGRGAEVSTEDLRQVLQHYRSFFGRLLST